MFKKEISFISDLNLNKLQVVGDRFTIDDLKSSKIHPSVLHYINASIDKEIFSDRKRIENNSIFDYKSDRINNYFILISEEVKRAQHFDLKYLKQIVQNAIIFNINFLTAPNKTLSKFIYGDYEIKTIEEIVLGISHAYYYRYLQKILLTYLDKKKVLSLTKEDFVQLLERVDIISRETHLEDTLTTAVNSMTNFFDQNSRISEKLPIKAIQMYLEEKKLAEFSLKLENNFKTESSTLFLGIDILNVLRSVTPESEIILEESKRVEDELIEDNNDYFDGVNSESQSNVEIDSNEDKTHFNDEEIFEDSENDLYIPNNEILSGDELVIEENKFEEIDGENPFNQIKLDEDFEEIIENDLEEDDSEEFKSNSADQNGEKPQKKKTDGIKLLKEIIDLSPLYNTLLSDLKPFDNFGRKLNLLDLIKNQSEDLNYKIDLTTLKDKLEIISKKHKTKNNLIEKDDVEYSNIETTNNRDLKSADIMENDYLEFGDSIDGVVNEHGIEDEFLSANETIEDLETNEDDENTIEQVANNISLVEEEITEVFSDLTFLDNKEIIANIDATEVQSSNEDGILNNTIDNLEISSSQEDFNIDDNSSNSFSGLLLSKDMSKIIELIFDYDMEEYFSIINKMSFCDNEDAAMQILEDYCNNNHIELASKEVETFKSIISEYFTKTYS